VLFRSTPAALGAVDLASMSWDVDVRGNLAYVAAGTAGMQVLDVSNPAAPAVIATLDTPGDARKLAVLGRYAFLAERGGTIYVIDVAAPASPAIAGSVFTANALYDFSRYRDRLYVGTDVGLFIIDIGNATVPRITRHLPNIPGPLQNATQSLLVHGDRLLEVRKYESFNTGCSFCFILTISDLSADRDQPVKLGQFGPKMTGHWMLEFSPGEYSTLVADGNMVYAVGEDHAWAIDISNPAAPVYRGDFETTGTHFGWADMNIRGRIGVVAWMEDRGNNRVWLSDLSNPADMMMSGSINLAPLGPYHGTAIASTHELVYTTGIDTYVFRFPGPTAGRFYVGRYDVVEDTAGEAPSSTVSAAATAFERQTVPVLVTASDDIAVASVTLSMDGVAVETDRTAPYEFLVTTAAGASSHTLVATATDYAGNSAQSAPVTIAVTRDTTAPSVALVSPISGSSVPAPAVRLLAKANDNFSVAKVEFFVNNALVGTDFLPPYELDYAFPSGMLSINAFARAYDMAGNSTDSPAATAAVFAPQTVASLAMPAGAAQDVELNGDYAYVAAGTALRIVNVAANPPVETGAVTLPSNVARVRLHGNHAFVTRSSAISIVDVTNPAAPAVVGTIATSAHSVAINGTRLYTGSSSPRVYDISNPAAPVLVRTNGIAWSLRDVQAYGNVLVGGLTANFSSGITALDIEHPQSNVVEQFFQEETSINRSTMRYGEVAAAGSGGLLVTSVADKFGWYKVVSAPAGDAVAMSDRYIFTGSVDTGGPAMLFEATNFRDPIQRGTINWSVFGAYRVASMFASPTALVAVGNGANNTNQLMIARYRDITDTSGAAPSVTFTAPPSAKLSRLVPLSAAAADDVAVKAVVFSVNGVDVYTDTVAPYEFNAMAPAGGTSMTVSARAIDFGGNASAASAATVTLIP
jgi:hypothetical protein